MPFSQPTQFVIRRRRWLLFDGLLRWFGAWRLKRAPEGAHRIKATGNKMKKNECEENSAPFFLDWSKRWQKQQAAEFSLPTVDRFGGAFKSSFRTDFSQSSTCSQIVWTWHFSPLGSRAIQRPSSGSHWNSWLLVKFNSWTIVSVQWV